MFGSIVRRSLGPVLPQTGRFSSACRRPSSAGQEAPERRRKHWALSVSPFTCLRAQLAACSLQVSPLDPHAFPAADRAFVTLHGISEGQETALDQCHVGYDAESRELRVSAPQGCSGLEILLQAPIKSNLYVSAEGGGRVHVSQMECDVCSVRTQQGDCTLHSVKGHQVEVRSSGGRVVGLGTIHGNVDIVTTGDGAVDVKKLQGSTMNISTEHGPVKVKAIYAESSNVSSRSGTVELGQVHGSAAVTNESGDTMIDGSNSLLKVSSVSGRIDVHVGDGGSAELLSQRGDVSVRLPSSVRAVAELRGSSVDIGPDVDFQTQERSLAPGQVTVKGSVNGDSAPDLPRVKAWTSGSVSLRAQSWFETLKLKS